MTQQNLRKISDVQTVEGVYVFVRASFNVPIKNGVVVNTFRIMQALPTISYLLNKKAKVILCSHLGSDGKESLAPVYEVLKKRIPVVFSAEVTGTETTSLRNSLKNGEALLLENVRKDAREKSNDKDFAAELSALADVFVSDDFAASHREHASLHALCSLLPSYVGINFDNEYIELSKALNPTSPSLFILGGAKFETKMPLVEKFLSLYDHVFIGGALANDFFKAKGYEVGVSLVSEMSLVGSPLVNHPKMIFPTDVIAVKKGLPRTTTPDRVEKDGAILDVGPATIESLGAYIENAKTILWNGPVGNYEGGYREQTLGCARKVAASNAYPVVGGGDTVASIESLQNQDQYSFLSTAGGAMLTILELGTLPGIEALKNSPSTPAQ